MNFTDILGSVLNQGMSPSAGRRVNNSIQANDGGIGDILNQLGGAGGGSGGGLGGLANAFGHGNSTAPPQTAPTQRPASPTGGAGGAGGGLLGSLINMAGSAMKSGPGGSNNPLVTGGLAALAGALFGGGKGSAKGALGSTALAIIGSMALKALTGRGGSPDSRSQLMAGLRAPENEQEAKQVEDIAELTVRAMLNAAKADGRIDREEINAIVGKASEDGLTADERDFISAEIRKPMETDALIASVPNQQVATQIYAASLLAIEVDTDAERSYLADLASRLGLDQAVVKQLQGALGVA